MLLVRNCIGKRKIGKTRNNKRIVYGEEKRESEKREKGRF